MDGPGSSESEHLLARPSTATVIEKMTRSTYGIPHPDQQPGLPAHGALRQLKKSLEAYWKGRETEADLNKTASGLRRIHWMQQKDAGVDLIPSNDFSFYDHVLDTAAMVGAVPERYGWKGSRVDLPTYFAMARGRVSGHEDDVECGGSHPGVHAMEMTKWFDSNYHYIVPELRQDQKFTLGSTKVIDEFQRR